VAHSHRSLRGHSLRIMPVTLKVFNRVYKVKITRETYMNGRPALIAWKDGRQFIEFSFPALGLGADEFPFTSTPEALQCLSDLGIIKPTGAQFLRHPIVQFCKEV